MRFLLLITLFLLSFAAFPGAKPSGATSTETGIATMIDVAAHNILCGAAGGHGPCQWVLALAGSAAQPDLASAAYGPGLHQDVE